MEDGRVASSLLSLFLSPSWISDVHLLIRVYGTLMHHPAIRPSLSSMRPFFRPNDDDTQSLHCRDEEDNANYELQTCTQALLLDIWRSSLTEITMVTILSC